MRRNRAAGFIIAVLVFGAFAALSYTNLDRIVRISASSSREVSITERLDNLLVYINAADEGRDMYFITGNEDYLGSYYDSVKILDVELKELGKLLSGNARQMRRLEQLEPLIKRRLARLGESIEVRKRSGPAAAQKTINEDEKRAYADIRSLVGDMIREEREILRGFGADTVAHARGAISTVLMGAIGSFLILYWIFSVLNREVTERRRAEGGLQRANESLSANVKELEQHNREMEIFSDMARMLQASVTSGEAYSVIDRSIRRLFPTESGEVYLLDEPRNVFESIASWGSIPSDYQVLSPDECWALRLGQTYVVDSPCSTVPCPHVRAPRQMPHICMPMTAQGKTLGLLYVLFSSADCQGNREAMLNRTIEHKKRLAATVAESIALALANFRLREMLYVQSTHDALTGLFNRRSMEELLDKELHRTARKAGTLAVIMLDIDHFKPFNDTFGHGAGDLLLRELGAFLQRNIRSEDYACRYGGEEFVIVLPGTSAGSARQRAEAIREGVKHISLQYLGRTLGRITVSLGVAVFPENGSTKDELLRAADKALYRAKAEGRDRVTVV